MTCDFCPRELPEGTAPQVDHRGRPVQYLCEGCNDREVRDRARRRRKADRESDRLIDAFQDVLEGQIRPLLRPGH
jgi:hypothetical protein